MPGAPPRRPDGWGLGGGSGRVLRDALVRIEREDQERHREGYVRHPVQPGEFDDWDDEQVWIE